MKNKTNLNRLDSWEKSWLISLQRDNKEYTSYNVKNLVICSAVEIAVIGITLCLSKPLNYAVPVFKDEITYYSNDEITYSSLDESLSIIEKLDEKKLDNLDELDILSVHSPWKKENGKWNRVISSYEINKELNQKLRFMYEQDSIDDSYLEVIEGIVPSIKTETTDIEPKEKEGYIEYKMIDNTSYLMRASMIDYMPSLLVLINSFLIILGSQHVVREYYEKQGLIRKVEYKENKENINELLKKTKTIKKPFAY